MQVLETLRASVFEIYLAAKPCPVGAHAHMGLKVMHDLSNKCAKSLSRVPN